MITVTFLDAVTTVDVLTNDVLILRLIEIRLFWENTQTRPRCSNWQIVVVYQGQKVSGRSGWKVWNTTVRAVPVENSREQQNVWKGGPFFPGQKVPNGNSCSVRVLQSHLYLIPLSAICGSFPVNVTDKCKWETRFMGTDLASETPLTRLWTNCWTGDSVFYLCSPSTLNRANSIICWKT